MRLSVQVHPNNATASILATAPVRKTQCCIILSDGHLLLQGRAQVSVAGLQEAVSP